MQTRRVPKPTTPAAPFLFVVAKRWNLFREVNLLIYIQHFSRATEQSIEPYTSYVLLVLHKLTQYKNIRCHYCRRRRRRRRYRLQ